MELDSFQGMPLCSVERGERREKKMLFGVYYILFSALIILKVIPVLWGKNKTKKKKRKVSKSSVTLQEHFYGLRTLSSATPNTGWGPLFYIIFSIYSLFSSICSSSLPLSTTAWSWVVFVSQWLLSRRCRNTSHSCTKCVSFLLTLEPWLMMLLWIQCRQNAQLDLLLNELV